jgi:hypothetical protein
LPIAAFISFVVGCARVPRDAPSPTATVSAATLARNSAVPLDHLAPGELQASSAMSFGFPLPTGMKLAMAFPDEAHMAGEVEVQGLVRYVQEHTSTAPPELQGNALVFRSVRMRHGFPDRTFRFEIVSKGRTTSLRIKDTTPTATAEPENITDEERWRKAGYKPNGEPLDIGLLQ